MALTPSSMLPLGTPLPLELLQAQLDSGALVQVSGQPLQLEGLAGRPLLMLPTQLEQFLIMRRVVRMGAGLGIAPDVPDPDYDVALAQLAQDPGFTRNAAAFAARYRSHSAPAALDTMVARILASAGAA